MKSADLFEIITGRREPEGLPETAAAAGLRALSLPYSLGARLRAAAWQRKSAPAHRLPAPVISVGNLTAGGTGKTPMILYLAEFFRREGRRVAILTRGYGGGAEKRGGVVCDGERIRLTPEQAGDEPWMLARRLKTVPVLAGRDRVASGRIACARFGADLLLLDDGFQHFRVRRDLNLLLMDAARPLGNGHVLPRGLLREPLTAVRRADAVIFTRSESAPHLPPDLRRLTDGLPLFRAVHRLRKPDFSAPEAVRQPPLLAFSGIADNEAFFRTVSSLGGNVQVRRGFPDHHLYSGADIAELIAAAAQAGIRRLVTTEKDMARLHAGNGRALNAFRRAGLSLRDVRIDMEILAGPVDFERFLRRRLETSPLENKIRHRPKRLPRPRAAPAAGQDRKIKKNINPAQIHRILVRSANWVGDAVMSAPLLHDLRHHFPGAKIVILAKSWVAPVFERGPDVDEIRIYDGDGRHKGLPGMWRLARELRQERFDLAVLVPNSFGSALIPRMAGIPRILGYAADGRRLLLTHPALRTAAHLRRHQTAYYQGILEGIGAAPGKPLMRLHTGADERQAAREFLCAAAQREGKKTGPLLGVNPGAAFGSAKRWPADRYADLIRSLGRQRPEALILIFGSPGEAALGESIRRAAGGNVLCMAGKTSLRQALCLIEQCDAFVTNDSGLMHIAAAFDVPQIAIFGPTKTVTTSPFSPKARIIRRPPPCAPCMKAECPPPHRHECMTGISADEVLAALADLEGGS